MSARHVVERCPSCGVEHEPPGDGACEACGTSLRPWCRRHGREAGWLSGPACHRCAEEAARPRLAPRPAPAPRPVSVGPAMRPAAERPRARPAGRPAHRPVPAPVKTRRSAWSLLLNVRGGLLRAVGGGGAGWLMGAVPGALTAFSNGTGVVETAASWGLTGGTLGLIFGAMHGVGYVIDAAAPPEE